MTRGPLSRRSFLSLGMVVALGAVGCADVDIHGPNAWGPWDPNFPDGRSRDFSAEAPFARQVDAAGLTALSLVGVAGTIEIVGVQGASVSIDAVRRVRSDSQSDADSSLQSLAVDVADRDGTLFVTTRQPQRTDERAYEVDYRITVPDGFDLFVVLVAGGIDVSVAVAENGVIDVSNVAGNVELQIPANTSASLRAEVVTGTIQVSGLAVDDADPRAGVLRGTLGSGSGSITLSTVAGDVIVRGR